MTKDITRDTILLYQTAYELDIQKTAKTVMTWDRRKEQANKAAFDVAPDVGMALKSVMIWRRNQSGLVCPLRQDYLEMINALLGWKTKINLKYAKAIFTPEPEAEPTPATFENGNGVGGPCIHVPKGYIIKWYEQWFQEHDVLHARDKELASALDCSNGAFTFARKKMEEAGYKLNHSRNGKTAVVDRPVDPIDIERQEKIDGLQKHLARLSFELGEAKAELDHLII